MASNKCLFLPIWGTLKQIMAIVECGTDFTKPDRIDLDKDRVKDVYS